MVSSSQSSNSSHGPAASSSPQRDSDDTLHGPNSSHTISSTSFTFVLNDPSQPKSGSLGDSAQRDRFAHTRTKRKRTSPADFAVLEREYDREPRPDRALRCHIASQVSLNEKEVQIWFQNRRQMTRRKARTWQPNEISEIIRSSQHSESSSPPPSQPSSSQENASSVSSVVEKQEAEINDRPAQGLFMNASQSTFRHSDDSALAEPVRDQQGVQAREAGSGPSKEKNTGTVVDETQQMQAVVGMATAISGIDAYEGQTAAPNPTSRQGDRTLRRTSSTIRLRTSLEGKAVLVLDKNSPSPPGKNDRRESWPARGGLRRSLSAFTPSSSSLEQSSSDAPPSSSQSSAHYRESLGHVGRSRDARAWQFFVDKESKDALSIAAEHDHRGSAQAALSLIRSNSAVVNSAPGSPLFSNPQRHNSFASGRAEQSRPGESLSEKRKSLENQSGARPKLPRTISSLARLQSSKSKFERSKLDQISSSQPALRKQGKDDGGIMIFQDGDSDSDKENWHPGTRISAPSHPRRAYAAAGSTAAPGRNAGYGALQSSRDGGNARQAKLPAAASGPRSSSGTDGDVAKFMGEDGGRLSSLADGDDMDAVQNLLRLSQGGRW